MHVMARYNFQTSLLWSNMHVMARYHFQTSLLWSNMHVMARYHFRVLLNEIKSHQCALLKSVFFSANN